VTFDPAAFLNTIRHRRGYTGQIVHVATLPARKARYAALNTSLSQQVQAALRAGGAAQLYTHQAEAINLVLGGRNVVVATSTASGKTLAFNAPVLEALARDPLARALYLYPTKALAQDQLGKWHVLTKAAGEAIVNPLAATYDGDTPQSARTRLRKNARVLLTNPDMLHAGILPNHPLWAEFFRHLKYVVIDEAHVYRGVFGSQVACVLRRLRRVCALYQTGDTARRFRTSAIRSAGFPSGKPATLSSAHPRATPAALQSPTAVSRGDVPSAGPQFIATTATIANPAEHFELLTGLTATVVTDDGSPHGPRTFALWNPPFIDRSRTARRSANHEASELFSTLVGEQVRTIVFARARVVAELLLRYARHQLKSSHPELIERVAAYRAGYLAEDRRRIERDLFGGRLLGVTATSALELGIDVGGLDASLMVGYPGTIASMWQQAGRAGRGSDPSLAMLIALDNPLDQYYMRHPDQLLGRPSEHALLDPDNVYILQRHLPCAAHESPLKVIEGGWDDEALFGPGFVDAMVDLENRDILRFTGDKWVYTQADYPSQDISLRDAEGDRFAVLNAANNYHMIEELSASTAPQRVHPGAVYLHQGETFVVTEYNADLRHAIVQPAAVDYYTQARELNDVRIVRSLRHRELPTTMAFLGRVRVRSQVVGFRRLQQFTEAVLSDEPLDMPVTEYETVSLWWDLPAGFSAALAARGLDFLGGIHAAEHAAIGILPLFAMCDRWDIGGLSTPRHPDTDVAQIFLYDGFPGGVGIAEKGFELLPELWKATLDVIRGCPCEGGCPSCVQSPKCGNGNQPLDKQAAAVILEWLLRQRRT
jgi:DEAD/DEAH box helicase domain-containing protein